MTLDGLPLPTERSKSDGGGDFIISEGGKKSREDDVKVDRRSTEDVLPLRLQERGE